MSPTYRFEHLHLLSRNPEATAEYYRKMFDVQVIKTPQPDGSTRIDLDLNGLSIYIMRVKPEEDVPMGPPGRYLGLDHFGFLVNNLDQTVAELKKRGGEFVIEPRTVRPGLRIAYIRAPENVRIELVERT